MTARDDLTLFSPEELARGLARLSTRENGEEIARLVGALPASERPFYRWAHEAVLLVSSLGPDVAARVRRYYAADDAETQARIAEFQEHFGRFLAALGRPSGGMRYRLQDVVIDVRPEAPANMIPAFIPPRRPRQGNYLDLATEDELRAALALMTSDESASQIAKAVYASPATEQVHYDWTHEAVMLLSSVSDALGERVRDRLAVLPEERQEIARQQRSFREFIREQGGRRDAFFDVGAVVRDSRVDD